MLINLRSHQVWLILAALFIAFQVYYFDFIRTAAEFNWQRLVNSNSEPQDTSSHAGTSPDSQSKPNDLPPPPIPSTPSTSSYPENFDDFDFNPSTLPSPSPSAKPSLPEDYNLPTNHSDWCEITYGPQYLEYIAEHHLPYCEDGARSALECFRTHNNDPLCVAKGVLFDPSAESPKHRLSMHCQLRNFTTERAKDPAKEEELKDIRNVAEFGEYFFSTGVRNQLNYWDISMKENENGNACNAQDNDNKYTLLVKREGNRNLWHKLMEMWQSMITIDAMQMSLDPTTNAPYLPSNKLPEVQVVFEDEEVGPVWDLWGSITGKDPIRLSSLGKTCLGNVFLPLAGSSSPFWAAHWEDKDCKQTFLLDTFLRRMYRHLGLVQQQRLVEDTTVTIIKRAHARRIVHLDEYVAEYKKRNPKITIQAIDFAELSLKDQIITMRHSDVLIGVIGAGMTHLMFLPKESSVGEIMPPNFHYAGFRNLAKMRSLSYFTTHAETQEEWEAHEGPFDEAAEDAKDKKPETETGKEKRNWQTDEWIFLPQDRFNALIDAAVQAQYNRGLLSIDVTPVATEETKPKDSDQEEMPPV